MSAPSPRILLITGVAGSGKSTLGQRAAAQLHWPYFEADDFHSPANRNKMERGIPLTDEDRAPWLDAIRSAMNAVRARGERAVFTCSALKQSYRDHLIGNANDVTVVFLTADFETILQRVSRRQGHFMKAEMVRSQFEALEPPRDALTLDVREPPDVLLQKLLASVRR